MHVAHGCRRSTSKKTPALTEKSERALVLILI